jgi:hypothetical protein
MPRDLEPDRQHLHPQAVRSAAPQGQEGQRKIQGQQDDTEAHEKIGLGSSIETTEKRKREQTHA